MLTFDEVIALVASTQKPMVVAIDGLPLAGKTTWRCGSSKNLAPNACTWTISRGPRRRIKNRCVLGGFLNPLTPNSTRHGDTGCGSILAGGGSWASSPTERGGYWSAPSSSAPRASAPAGPTNASSAAKPLTQFSLCIGALPRRTPGQKPRGSPNPFWDDRALRSERRRLLRARRLIGQRPDRGEPFRLGVAPHFCHTGQSGAFTAQAQGFERRWAAAAWADDCTSGLGREHALFPCRWAG
jgi:hypothetical protein